MNDRNDEVFKTPRTSTEGKSAATKSTTSEKKDTSKRDKRKKGWKQATTAIKKAYKSVLKNELATMYALGDVAISLFPGGRKTADVVNKHLKDTPANLLTPAKELVNFYSGLGKALFNHPEWWGGNSNIINGTPIRQITGSTYHKLLSVTTIQWEYSSLSSIYAAQIDALIGAYAAQRGYASTLTGAKVMTYLHDSFDLLTLLFAGIRAQNAKRARSVDGRNISGTLTTTTSVQFSGLDKTNADNGIPVLGTTGTLTAWGVEDISNATWVQQYLSILNRVFVSPEALDFAEYLFKHFFQSNAFTGDTDLTAMYPTDAYVGLNIQSFPTAYNAQVAALEAAIAADPDLIPILRMLGFTTAFEQDPEMNRFRRDLSGNNVQIVFDPTFTLALKNMLYNYNFSEFSYGTQFYCSVDLDVPGLTIMNDLENQGIPIGVLGSAWKFRDCIPLESHLLSTSMTLSGPYIILPDMWFNNGTGFPTNNAVIGYSRLQHVKAIIGNPMFAGHVIPVDWNVGNNTYWGPIDNVSSSRYVVAASTADYNRIRSMAYENLLLLAPVVGDMMKLVASLSSAQYQMY